MNVRTIGVAVACLFALSGCASTPTMGWEIPPTPTEAWLVAAGPCANLVEPISRVENAYRDALAARISQEEFTRQLQIASEEIPAAELPEPVATALQAPLDSLNSLILSAQATPTISETAQSAYWAALEPVTVACRAAGGDLPLRVKNGSEG